MNDFSADFSTSTDEIILFVVLSAVLGIALLIGRLVQVNARRQRQTSKRGTKSIRTTSLQQRCEQLGLTKSDHSTLERLAWLLKNPDNPQALTNNTSLFVKAARKAIVEGIVEPRAAHQLARRLSVPCDELDSASRPSEIPIGTSVLLTVNQLKEATGKLVAAGKQWLRVKLEHGKRFISDHSHVELRFKARHGLYYLLSIVETKKNNEVVLRRASPLKYIQRRRHVRRKVSLPVVFQRSSSPDTARRTQTQDLSIGGASLKNPSRTLRVGDQVKCKLMTTRDQPIVVQGAVLRTSCHRRVAHVEFSEISETTEQRLFRALLALRRTRP